LGFNTPAPWGASHGGTGDLFPRIRKDFKEKSSIPQGLPCGSSFGRRFRLFLRPGSSVFGCSLFGIACPAPAPKTRQLQDTLCINISINSCASSAPASGCGSAPKREGLFFSLGLILGVGLSLVHGTPVSGGGCPRQLELGGLDFPVRRYRPRAAPTLRLGLNSGGSPQILRHAWPIYALSTEILQYIRPFALLYPPITAKIAGFTAMPQSSRHTSPAATFG
jgi:hypothetical protein